MMSFSTDRRKSFATAKYISHASFYETSFRRAYPSLSVGSSFRAATPRYDGDLSAESWKMHYIGLGHSLERIPRFAPGCQAAYDDKCLESPFP